MAKILTYFWIYNYDQNKKKIENICFIKVFVYIFVFVNLTIDELLTELVSPNLKNKRL